MVELSLNQLTFLRSQSIPLSAVFDASGMKKAEYQAAMRAEEKSFAFGVTPCAAGGHTIRTRAGHCIQCDHSKIAYMIRHDARAFVYIAASAAGRFIKIGFAIDVADRREKLNLYRYGGQSDWQTLATASCTSAGRAESVAQTKLSCFAVDGDYIREGKLQRCYELLRCDFSDALDALQTTLGKSVIVRVPNLERAVAAFRFR